METLRSRTLDELRELQEDSQEIERLALESQEVGARRWLRAVFIPFPGFNLILNPAGSGAAAGKGDGPGCQQEPGRAEPEIPGAAGVGA